MTEDEFQQIWDALTKMEREKSKRAYEKFLKDVDDGIFDHDQLVGMYNVIVQRLLSPE